MPSCASSLWISIARDVSNSSRELRPAILPRKLEPNARVLLGVQAQVSAALATWDDVLARTEDVLRET